MIEIAKKFILDLILENEAVKSFPKDFVTASMQWVRSWFLVDDPVAEAIMGLPGNAEAKTTVIEAKLPKLLENADFKHQLEAKLVEYQSEKAKLKNVLKDTDLTAKGDVHIGDKGATQGEEYDQKNVVSGGSINVGGNFRLGDDIVFP